MALHESILINWLTSAEHKTLMQLNDFWSADAPYELQQHQALLIMVSVSTVGHLTKNSSP